MLVLPVRPSLEFLRKQAKKLARDIAAGNADAVARAHAQLPNTELPLSRRDAQLVLAREYGLEHGADINTDWSTHEPARMLHECAVHGNYDAARFLIDRGIDMTRLDYRWNATAEGWARYAAKDEQMADFLAAAAREQIRK